MPDSLLAALPAARLLPAWMRLRFHFAPGRAVWLRRLEEAERVVLLLRRALIRAGAAAQPELTVPQPLWPERERRRLRLAVEPEPWQ